MSRSYNNINVSDISTTAIKLKHLTTYTSASVLNSGIKITTGINQPITALGPFTSQVIKYKSIQQLYYSNFLTGSYLTTTSSFDNYMQSTAASGTLEADIRYFPTQSNATIKDISVPVKIYGENIARSGFAMTSSTYSIIDDGNGNLIDKQSTPINAHVGNIIYAHGEAIITNSSYLSSVDTAYSMSIVAETTIYQNEVRCHINENDFNYSQNPTVFKNVSFTSGSSAFPYYTPISSSAISGIITDGTLINAVTGSDFMPYATTVGLFNEAGDLLVVGKLAVPYPIPSHTDLTFVIRYDS